MFLLKPSFAGGELSPAMYGRTDFVKYDNGAATLKNFLVQRYGGISNRAGTKYIDTLPGKTVLRSFRFNSSQNYIIAFYNGGIKVYQGEALKATLTNSPYTTNELRYIKFTQSADVMFLVHPNHPPMKLTREGDTNWVLETFDITGGPFEDPNTTATQISASAKTGNITLTATQDYFTTDMVGSLIKIGHTVGSEYKSGIPVERTSTAADGSTTTIPADDLSVTCVPGGTVYIESFGFWSGNFTLEKYVDGSWTKIRTQEGDHSSNYNFTETNDHDSVITYKITSTKFDITIWEGENEKQKGHVTIQSFSQDYYGIAKINSVTSGTTASATVIRQLGDTKATKDFAISPWSNAKGYPMCANFFEDRLFFAGNYQYGQSFWGSKSGDYPNFGTSIPSADTDAVTGTLNGGQVNGIKAMVSFGELIMLTAGGEHKVSGVNNQALAPGKMKSQAQEYRGISDIDPVTVGSRIVYVQQQGNIVRDLAYTYESDKYTGDDINLLAEHLFERHKLVSMAYQQTPNSIVWCVRDDGLLLGLTYLKEQEVYAWHQHSTGDANDGFFDVACIAGTSEDELWCVVNRHGTYCLEKMAQRDSSDSVEEQYFVDCGKQVSSSPGVTSVTGLSHLNGRTVSILADGFVLPQQVVANGSVSLGHTYHKVSVGLPITSELKTLPLELQAQDGSTITRKKRVAKLTLFFKESSGGAYGLDENRLDEIKWRSNERYDAPINLFSGKKSILMPGATYNETVQVVVRQTDPLPMTILSIVPEMQVGG